MKNINIENCENEEKKFCQSEIIFQSKESVIWKKE